MRERWEKKACDDRREREKKVERRERERKKKAKRRERRSKTTVVLLFLSVFSHSSSHVATLMYD